MHILGKHLATLETCLTVLQYFTISLTYFAFQSNSNLPQLAMFSVPPSCAADDSKVASHNAWVAHTAFSL